MDTIYFYPTDTVWGMGGDIFNAQVQTKILQIKQNSPNKPLSILFTSCDRLNQMVDFSSLAIKNYLELFQFECTLGIPLKYTSNIPNYIYKTSPYVFIRFIPALYLSLPEVVTTTSINFRGEPPINCITEIKNFMDKIKGSDREIALKFVESELNPSGNASSIIQFSLDGQINIVRQGRHFEKLLELLGLEKLRLNIKRD